MRQYDAVVEHLALRDNLARGQRRCAESCRREFEEITSRDAC